MKWRRKWVLSRSLRPWRRSTHLAPKIRVRVISNFRANIFPTTKLSGQFHPYLHLNELKPFKTIWTQSAKKEKIWHLFRTTENLFWSLRMDKLLRTLAFPEMRAPESSSRQLMSTKSSPIFWIRHQCAFPQLNSQTSTSTTCGINKPTTTESSLMTLTSTMHS